MGLGWFVWSIFYKNEASSSTAFKLHIEVFALFATVISYSKSGRFKLTPKAFTFDSVQDLTTIKTQLATGGLFDAFKLQLTKDFDQCTLPTGFIASLEADYGRLHHKIVTELERCQKTKVMQLLNRIDISEAQLKKYLHEQQNENPLHVMAELIIKRVLQKVVIKQFYKGKEQA